MDRSYPHTEKVHAPSRNRSLSSHRSLHGVADGCPSNFYSNPQVDAKYVHHHSDRAKRLIMPVYWDTMNWEAAAGFSAVLAALIVGLRQSGILSRQVRLEQQKAQADVFDRRMAVYDATREWLMFMNDVGRAPWEHGPDAAHGTSVEREREKTIKSNYLTEFEKARFLFSPAVFERLERVTNQALASDHEPVWIRIFPVDEDPIPSTIAAAYRRSRIVDAKLTEIFGDEIHLAKI